MKQSLLTHVILNALSHCFSSTTNITVQKTFALVNFWLQNLMRGYFKIPISCISIILNVTKVFLQFPLFDR